jgi:alkaline phosphatase
MRDHFEKHMGYSFSDKDIDQLMRSSKNQFYRPDHKNLKLKEVPHIEDFAAFYSYGNIVRSNIFARVLAHKQSAVWATASHTSTPVTMITVGPKSLTDEFNGLLHSTEVGRKTIKALGLKKEYKTVIK